MVGTLVFADGSTSNINIPVETSGIIGITRWNYGVFENDTKQLPKQTHEIAVGN